MGFSTLNTNSLFCGVQSWTAFLNRLKVSRLGFEPWRRVYTRQFSQDALLAMHQVHIASVSNPAYNIRFALFNSVKFV